ncbi:MAG: hypothetical protein ABSA47_14395 [Verrucomicrobiota bacterium]|jgi:hypothetical protein
MSDQGPIHLSDGQTLLIIVKDGCVIEYTWDMALTHVEFVKRRVGNLPEGAWVGTVSKIKKDPLVFSSKTFYGHQMPAPQWVTSAVRALFKQVGAHLGTTTIEWNDPLSLALSPLRGERELANRKVLVARCAQ